MPRCPPRMRAVSVAKYQPPLSSSGAGARRRCIRPSASRIARVATAAANSGSWVATRIATPASERRQQLRGERRLGGAVHPARRLIQAQHGRLRGAVADDREREALALAGGAVARMAIGERREARALERVRAELVADAVLDEVVAGVLQQQRDATGALDATARGLEQAGRVAKERRLAGAVSAEQGDALARRDRERDAGEDRAAAGELVPDAAQAQRRGRAAVEGRGRALRRLAAGREAARPRAASRAPA